MALYGLPVWEGGILICAAQSKIELDEFINEITKGNNIQIDFDGFSVYSKNNVLACPFSFDIDADYYILCHAFSGMSPFDSVEFLCNIYNIMLIESINELQLKVRDMRIEQFDDDDNMTIEDFK